MHASRLLLALSCALLLAPASRLTAAEPPKPAVASKHCGCQHCQAKAQARAGYPHSVSRFAKPSYKGPYYGYYVGGSAPFFGQGKAANEGTFGWDYTGVLFTKRVFLNWRHGKSRTQKRDSYKTDGPHLKKHK